MTYKVRLLVMSSGERLPVLCSSNGQPMGEPLMYALTELRARGRSSATIRHALEAIMVLQMTLDCQQIDLDARLTRGVYLQLHELDLITRVANQPIRAVKSELARQVSRASAANRLHYILHYLRWYAHCHLMRLNVHGKEYLSLRDRVDKACDALKARSPCSNVRGDVDQRQGLSAQHLQAVQDVIAGDVPVWGNEHAMVRNRLIVRWLLELGVRRGELLGIRISDIDFQQSIVRIARRADARDDPRAQQPLAKTRARDLPLNEELAEATRDYVIGHRLFQGSARHHDYLFVSGGTGSPLSLPGLNKMFAVLRASGLGLPESLTPHVLRHTWNDCFSAQMERAGVGHEQEKKMRSVLMGWSPTSETASTYTRRYVQRKAGEVIEGMQSRLRMKRSEE